MPDSLDTIRVAYDGIVDRYVAFVKAVAGVALDDALIDAFAELAGDAGRPVGRGRAGRGRPAGAGTR